VGSKAERFNSRQRGWGKKKEAGLRYFVCAFRGEGVGKKKKTWDKDKSVAQGVGKNRKPKKERETNERRGMHTYTRKRGVEEKH